MPRRKTDKGYYLVKCESKDYNYGAFPKTAYGKEQAEEYIKKLKKQSPDDDMSFYIVEK